MTIAISSHGTMIARAKAATPTVFEDIAELGDLTGPDLMRNKFAADTQDKDIDSNVLGMLRRGDLVIPMNLLPTNATHDHLTGLYKAIIDNSIDGYRVTFPTGVVWVMSGQVQHLAPKAPVDGKLAFDVTLTMSGKMTIGGVVIG